MPKSKNKRKNGKIKKYKGPKFNNQQLNSMIPMTSKEKKEHELLKVEQNYSQVVNQLHEDRVNYQARFVNLRTTAALEAIKLDKLDQSPEAAIAYGTKFAEILRETDQEYNDRLAEEHKDSEVLIKRRDDLIARLELMAPEKYKQEDKVIPLENESKEV